MSNRLAEIWARNLRERTWRACFPPDTFLSIPEVWLRPLWTGGGSAALRSWVYLHSHSGKAIAFPTLAQEQSLWRLTGPGLRTGREGCSSGLAMKVSLRQAGFPGEVCSSRIAEAQNSQGPADKWEPKAEEGEVPALPWLSLLDPRRT